MSMNRVHYDVTGIQNTQMKTQVKNVLEKLEGVQQVNVNLANSTIDVSYNKKTDEESIRNCIEHVGGKIES